MTYAWHAACDATQLNRLQTEGGGGGGGGAGIQHTRQPNIFKFRSRVGLFNEQKTILRMLFSTLIAREVKIPGTIMERAIWKHHSILQFLLRAIKHNYMNKYIEYQY